MQMSDLNNYCFTGRLGNAAELKYTQNGTAIWNASVGVGYGYGDNKGTNWIRVQVFGKRAESLGSLDLAKGAAVGITGELRVRTYDAKDGSKGTSVEVVAQDVALLGPRPEGNTSSSGSRGGAPIPEFGAPAQAFGAREGSYFNRRSLPQVPRKYTDEAERLFFGGGPLPEFAPQVDKQKAMQATRALLSSFAPSHEAKIATVGYAFWVWSTPDALAA
jgi:single-strand DNA-binding protein